MLTCTNCVVCCACKWLTYWLSYSSLYESESNCEVVCQFLIGHLYPIILGKKSLPNFCSESEWHVLFSSCLYRNFYDFLNNHEIVAFEYGWTDCMSYVEHILDKCIFARVYRSVDQDKEGSNMRTLTRCACTYKDCNKMTPLIDC